MIDVSKFFALHEGAPQPIFKTKRDLRVETYIFRVCENPYANPEMRTIPAGTHIVRSHFSNFGTGHSMSRVKGRRWFRVEYEDMELDVEATRTAVSEWMEKLFK